MKGYFKIKENNPLAQKLRSNKEFQFLDHDVDLQHARHSSKQTHDHHQLPIPTIDDDHDDDDDDHHDQGNKISRERSHHKNKKNGNNNQQLERQSSTRSIQEAVKRAFSTKRSSSVNYSERYCRIHDQPMSTDDDYDYDLHNYDDDFVRNNVDKNGAMEETKMMKKNSKNKYVGSKVVKVCKSFFRR